MRTHPGENTADDSAANPALWSRNKRKKYGWFIAVLLTILMMLNWADKAVIGLAAVPIMNDLDITPQQLGMVSSGMFLAFTLTQLLVAPLTTKFRTKPMILLMCIIWSVAQVPVVALMTLPALWISRLLLGIGEGPYAPVAMHAVFKWFPRQKGATPAALTSSGVTLGIVAFAPILAFVIVSFGWKTAFAGLAVCGIAFAILWTLVGKEGPYESLQAEREIEGITDRELARQSEVAVETHVPFFKTILNPSWFFAVLVSFFGYWTFSLAMTWGPAYFETVLGYSRGAAGSLIALPALWGFICTVGLSNITERLDLKGVPTKKARAQVVGLAGLLSGASLLLSTLVTQPGLALALLVLGFGTAPAMFAVTYLIVGELTSIRQRPAHLNVANAGLSLGGIVAPSVGGILVGTAATPAQGYVQAFQLTGALTALAAIGCIVFVNQQRERRKLGLIQENSIPTAPVPCTDPAERTHGAARDAPGRPAPAPVRRGTRP